MIPQSSLDRETTSVVPSLSEFASLMPHPRRVTSCEPPACPRTNVTNHNKLNVAVAQLLS